MSRRKRSKWLDEVVLAPRMSQSITPSGRSLHGLTAPAGSAAANAARKDGGHDVAGESRTSAAYPNANGRGTKTDEVLPPRLPVSRGARLQVERRDSIEHERYVAHALRGWTTPASGALGIVGDVHADPLVVSCKRTVKKTIDLVNMIEEACRYAAEEDLVPAVALRLHALADGVERDWAVVPLRTLSALMHGRGTDAEGASPQSKNSDTRKPSAPTARRTGSDVPAESRRDQPMPR